MDDIDIFQDDFIEVFPDGCDDAMIKQTMSGMAGALDKFRVVNGVFISADEDARKEIDRCTDSLIVNPDDDISIRDLNRWESELESRHGELCLKRTNITSQPHCLSTSKRANADYRKKQVYSESGKMVYYSGPAPCGYKHSELYYKGTQVRKIIADREVAIGVKFIFKKYLELQSTRAVAKACKKRGYLNASGRNFTDRVIRSIISNPVYMGYIWDLTRTVKRRAEHSGLVSKDVWEAANEILQKNAQEMRMSPHNFSQIPFGFKRGLKKKLVVRESEMDVVKFAFDEYVFTRDALGTARAIRSKFGELERVPGRKLNSRWVISILRDDQYKDHVHPKRREKALEIINQKSSAMLAI